MTTSHRRRARRTGKAPPARFADVDQALAHAMERALRLLTPLLTARFPIPKKPGSRLPLAGVGIMMHLLGDEAYKKGDCTTARMRYSLALAAFELAVQGREIGWKRVAAWAPIGGVADIDAETVHLIRQFETAGLRPL